MKVAHQCLRTGALGAVKWARMAFWGVEVKPGKVCPFVPPPEGSKLHLSQVCARLTPPFLTLL